jgi:hypothetical protein
LAFLLRSDSVDESTDFEDESSYSETLTAHGTVKHDSEQKKWCVTSVYFDGNSDYISGVDPSPQLDLGTGDFTMECWFRPNSGMLTAANRFMSRGSVTTAPDGQWTWGIGDTWGGGVKMNFADRSGGSVSDHLSNALSVSAGNWYHFCIERYNGTLYFYVDGIGVGSVSCSHNLNCDNNFYVGCRYSGASPVEYADGWGEDFAIYNYSKNEGSNFTPPSGPLEDYICDSTTTTTTTHTTTSSSTTTTTTEPP